MKKYLFTAILASTLAVSLVFGSANVKAESKLSFDDAIKYMQKAELDNDKINKMVNQGLSKNEAIYYEKLDKIKQYMEQNNIVLDLDKVEGISREEFIKNIDESHNRILNGDKAALKFALIDSFNNDEELHQATSLAKKLDKSAEVEVVSQTGKKVTTKVTKKDNKSNGFEKDTYYKYPTSPNYYSYSYGTDSTTAEFRFSTSSYYSYVKIYGEYYTNGYYGGNPYFSYLDRDGNYSGFLSSFAVDGDIKTPNGTTATTSTPASAYVRYKGVVSRTLTLTGGLSVDGGAVGGSGSGSVTFNSGNSFSQYVYLNLYAAPFGSYPYVNCYGAIDKP